MKVLLIAVTVALSVSALGDNRDTATADSSTSPQIGVKRLPTIVVDRKPEPMSEKLKEALWSRENAAELVEQQFDNLEF